MERVLWLLVLFGVFVFFPVAAHEKLTGGDEDHLGLKGLLGRLDD
jgi:hypothetical protein